ncbi:MAG: DUF2911 domain-containing protein [Gemmatimonadaceae bacterium]|nr:DUF2911 domain-containing protein [Gemmatimonadaceae bacterium]
MTGNDRELLAETGAGATFDCSKGDAMKRMSRCQRAAIVLATCLGVGGCAARTAPVPLSDRGVLFLSLGPDTLLVERFELSPERLYVESVVRAPRAMFRTIDAPLYPDGSFATVRVAAFDAAAPRSSAARDSTIITFSADSTFYEFGLGAAKQFLRLQGRGDVVISFAGNYSFPQYLLLAARTPPAGDTLRGVFASRLGSFPLVARRTRDTVAIWSQVAGAMRVIVAPDGRGARLDGTSSSLGYVGTRRDWIDIDSVSRAFAERERMAGAVGVLSVRDTARASVDGAQIAIDYGRPTQRGRTIFGNVVPWNRVWRTGANLATHMTTNRALELEGFVLPAGRYTLYAIPAPESWTLLISTETGQWGSAAIDEARIVARLPMRVVQLDEPVETFTIAVDRSGTGGVLRMAWDRTAAEIGILVR